MQINYYTLYAYVCCVRLLYKKQILAGNVLPPVLEPLTELTVTTCHIYRPIGLHVYVDH